MAMTVEQKQAYEWAKNQNYTSVAARYAKVLADMVDELSTRNESGPAQRFECDAEHCAYNPDGICKFALVYGREPVLHDDGCNDFCFKEDLPIGKFGQAYLEAERELRAECDEMVRNGELSEEDAEFRFQMVRDEILESMIAADMDQK